MRERHDDAHVVRELVKYIEENRQRDNGLFHSRFFELRNARGEDGQLNGRKFLTKVTEQFISRSIDEADCGDGEEQEFLYMEDDGSLHPVTIGEMSRQDMEEHEIVYGSASMIANGKVVGTVIYTDH
jgi:hypothetical protein